MEYLVTMTTRVPAGTPDQTVEDVRARETVRGRELAERGHMLRLWRPPLGPGEWRSIGLFAAGGDAELEKILASMPLRIWRTDQVTPLVPHPHDPARPIAPARPPEFLTRISLAAGVEEPDWRGQDHLVRLWRRPAGAPGTLGLWRTRDAGELHATLASLPQYASMTVETTPLTGHPNDPGAAVRP